MAYSVIEDTNLDRTVTLSDQFEVKTNNPIVETMLFIPCLKEETVPNQESTCGKIKSSYTE